MEEWDNRYRNDPTLKRYRHDWILGKMPNTDEYISDVLHCALKRTGQEKKCNHR